MNILNRFLAITILAILAVTLASCGGGSSNGLGSGSVSGMASKGPFMADSTVTAYVLATDGSRNTATAAIPPINTGKLGAFAFDNLAGNVELEVYGFYLNENTGNTSTAPATLTSVVAVGGSANNFNINVFTDIEAGHIKALMAAGNTFADAKTVATTTVADLFNLSAEANLSELDLTDGSNEDNLILLRASAAIAKTPTILVDLQTAISADDTAAQAQEVANINANIASLDFAMIAQNIAALGSTTVTAAALTALNKAPTISEFPNLISTIEDATSGFLGGNLAVMDDSDSVDDITIIGSSTNPNLVDRVVITPFTSISAPAVNHTIEIILKENAHGNATIIITATDSDGLSNSAQFPLTISPVVDAVEAAAGTPTAVTLSENDPAGTVVVSAAAAKSYFINVDKSVLTYTLAGDNRNAFEIAAATGEITAFQQFNDGQVGDYTLVITATDAANNTANVSVAVEITNVNDAPVGAPRITGHVVIGQTITANTDDIRDEDGLGTFLYVWRKNGDNIAGATNATLELTDANVSLRDQITVTIAYTDSGSNIESLTSASIRVSAGSVVITSANSVIVGSTVALTADTFPVANGIIAWTISGSGTDIASINGSTLTGVAPGVVTLIAVDFASTVLSTQEFTVFPVPITSITITNAASVGIGETVELTATVLPSAANQTPIWSIQGSANVATLNGTTLTAIAAGTVIVFATADDGSDSPEVATQTFSVTLPGPTTLGAVATGAPHQVLIFWDEVAGATNYKIYQTSADLSAFAGGTAANLSTANPAPASPAETSETNIALNLTGSATVHFLVTAVANGVESSTSAEEVTATGHSLNFTAIDGVGSSVWTDRNLGATIRQESTGGVEDAVGDLYQWGRPADGHQLRNSNNTAARATTISPGHANFITSSSRPDWLDPTSQATVDARAEFWKTLDGSGICPTGFRVPSIAELEAERVSWSSNNRAGAVAAGLRWVPRTDQRSGVNGTAPRSTGSFYWSTDNVSDGVNITGQYLETTQFDAETSDGSFDTGLAVRCIRDSAITISSAEVISFAPPNKQAFINSYSQMFFRLVAVSEATYEIVKSDSKVRARQKLFDFTYQRISNTEARIVVNASVFTDEDFSYEYRLIFATFDTGRVEVYQGTGADPTGFTLADDETNSFFTLTFR